MTIPTRGRGISLTHFGITLGHALSVGGLYYLTKGFNPKITFSISAGISILVAIGLMFMVVEPKNSETIRGSAHYDVKNSI